MLKKISTFLNDLPGWCVLAPLLLIAMWIQFKTGDVTWRDLVNTLVAGLLGILVGRRDRPASNSNTTISGDIVGSPSVAADTMEIPPEPQVRIVEEVQE